MLQGESNEELVMSRSCWLLDAVSCMLLAPCSNTQVDNGPGQINKHGTHFYRVNYGHIGTQTYRTTEGLGMA
jgi:hypothetical protein